jgi:hypothetical protein
MPIDLDRFETDPEELLDDGRDLGPGHVLSFLRSNPDRAFTSAEIQAEIGSGPSLRSAEAMGISGVLSGLESRGVVRRRMGYWVLSESGAGTATRSEQTGRARVVYEGPDGPEEHTPSDVRRERGWVVLTVGADGDEERLEVPRERVYSIAFE